VRPRKTKIGTEVVHVSRDSDTTCKVKGSKVNLQGVGVGAYCGGLRHSLVLRVYTMVVFSALTLLSGCKEGHETAVSAHSGGEVLYSG